MTPKPSPTVPVDVEDEAREIVGLWAMGLPENVASVLECGTVRQLAEKVADTLSSRDKQLRQAQRDVWDKAIEIAKDKTRWGDKEHPEYLHGVVAALEQARDKGK